MYIAVPCQWYMCYNHQLYMCMCKYGLLLDYYSQYAWIARLTIYDNLSNLRERTVKYGLLKDCEEEILPGQWCYKAGDKSLIGKMNGGNRRKSLMLNIVDLEVEVLPCFIKSQSHCWKRHNRLHSNHANHDIWYMCSEQVNTKNKVFLALFDRMLKQCS